jgi:hypothetical protein
VTLAAGIAFAIDVLATLDHHRVALRRRRARRRRSPRSGLNRPA